MTADTELMVNGEPIELEEFVASFLEQTVAGMAASLKDTSGWRRLSLEIRGEDVALSLDGNRVPTNEFVNLIFKSTIAGMVSPLKGVEGTVETLVFSMER